MFSWSQMSWGTIGLVCMPQVTFFVDGFRLLSVLTCCMELCDAITPHILFQASTCALSKQQQSYQCITSVSLGATVLFDSQDSPTTCTNPCHARGNHVCGRISAREYQSIQTDPSTRTHNVLPMCFPAVSLKYPGKQSLRTYDIITSSCCNRITVGQNHD